MQSIHSLITYIYIKNREKRYATYLVIWKWFCLFEIFIKKMIYFPNNIFIIKTVKSKLLTKWRKKKYLIIFKIHFHNFAILRILHFHIVNDVIDKKILTILEILSFCDNNRFEFGHSIVLFAEISNIFIYAVMHPHFVITFFYPNRRK